MLMIVGRPVDRVCEHVLYRHGRDEKLDCGCDSLNGGLPKLRKWWDSQFRKSSILWIPAGVALFCDHENYQIRRVPWGPYESERVLNR